MTNRFPFFCFRKLYFLLVLTLFTFQLQLHAQNYADGSGKGKLQKGIFWLSWSPGSNNLVSFPDGSTSTNLNAGEYVWQFTPGVKIVATVDSIVGPNKDRLSSYTPGNYAADGLGWLYPVGGAWGGIPNSGLVDGVYGSTVSFNIKVDLQMYINGVWQSITYPGMVVGDAESLASDKNSGIVEYLEATLVQPNSTWQLLDFRDGYWDSASVASNYLITITDNGRRFVDSMKGWNANQSVQAVLYAKNAYSLRQVKSRGQGITAVAVGIVAPFDFGDALASYGNAGSYMGKVKYNTLPDLTDGLYTAVNMPQIYITPYTDLYLGTNNTDPDGTPPHSSSATNDNVHDNNDEDGFNLATQPIIGVNNNTNVKFIVKASNKGNTDATVYGWVDFNRDSLFSVDESAVATLPSGTIDSSIELIFNYNNYKNNIKMGPTYARFRVTTTPLIDSIGTLVDERSINIALDGETEDYKLNDIVLGKALPVGVKDIDSTPINKGVTTNVKANDGSINANDTVKIYTQPLNGIVSIDNKGKVVYSPNPNYSGKDVYYYTITNLDTATSTPIMVTILVKPVGIFDSATVQMNNSIDINVKANDSAKGLKDTVAILTPPKNGVAIVKPDGIIFYNPNTDFTGNDTLTYTLMTGDSVFSTPVYVYLTVVKHKADVVIKKLLKTSGRYYSGKSVDFSLIVTNNGPDSATGVVALDTLPTNLGIATNFTTNYGSAIYNPSTSSVSWNVGVLPKNQIDTLTFTTQIISGTLLTNTAFVKGKEAEPDTSNNRSTITPMIIVPLPAGIQDIDSTNINNSIVINVKANDGTPAKLDSITVAAPPINGTAIVNKDSTVTYQPNPSFAGKDSFTYTLFSPDSLVSRPVIVTILVKPVGVADLDSTPMNTGINIHVKGNDSAKGLNDTVAIINPPKNGVAIVKPDGTIYFTPKTDFVGKDTLTYTLMTGDSVFSVPIFVYITVFKAKADIVITKLLNTKGNIVIGKSVDFSLVITNNGPDSATAVMAFDTLANNLGVATNLTTKNGSANYIPSSSSISWNVGVLHKNEIDTLRFTTQIIGGTVINNTANIEGKELDPDTSNNRSTINAIIAPIPTGVMDIDSTTINQQIIINVKANDGTLAKLDSVTLATPPINGTAIVNKDSTVTYKPIAGFVGKDSFTYTLFSPDSLVSKPVTVTIFVKPVGVTDIDTTPMNTGIKIFVKGNDSAKGVNDTLAIFSQPKNGTAIVKPDGTIYYNPKTDFVGNDMLTYTLMTGDSVFSNPVYVYLTIIKPRADIVITKILNTKGSLIVGKNVEFSLIVTNNGPDSATGIVALDTLSANLGVATNISTANGIASYLSASTSISWKLDKLLKNQKDTLTFSTTIISGTSLINTAIVKAEQLDPDTSNNHSSIAPKNIYLIPTGVRDIDTTLMNTPVVINVKANDGTTAIVDTVQVVQSPNNGNTNVNIDGTITYQPNTGFNGKDTFTYHLISPDSVVSVPISVIIFVKPIGVNDLDSTTINKPLIITVKANDGLAVSKDSVKIASIPVNGTVTVDNKGNVTYTPNPGFTGKDVFTYTLITPDSVISSPITSTVYVKPVGVLDRDSTPMNIPIKINVKNNDSAKGGNNMEVINSKPKNGSITLNQDSTITYTPNLGFIGKDTCTYLLMTSDSVFSAPIYVYLTVYKPKADVSIVKVLNTALPIVVGQRVSFTLTITNNGPDSATGIVALDTLAFNLGVATNIIATNGTATFNNFTSALVWNLVGLGATKSATLTFSSSILGGSSFVNSAKVIANELDPDTTNNRSAIPVVQFATTPKGVTDYDTTTINTPIIINVKSNDGISENNDTVKVVNPPANAIAIVNNGNIIYTPNNAFLGKDSLTYTLTNTSGMVSPPIKVYILVLPSGVNDTDTTEQNTPVTTAIIKNDGPSTSQASPVLSSPPLKGKVIFNGNGTVTYVPDSSFVGVDSYQYVLVTKNGLTSAPITVTIMVVSPIPKSCDLEIVKEMTTTGSLYVGETINFSITVTNNGPNDATGIVAEDLYPINLSKPKNISATVGFAAYVDNSNALIWNIGGLASGQVSILTFSAMIDSGSVLNNSASVLGKQPDPDLTNNHSSIQQKEIFPFNLVVPNVITPNGDGKNDKFIITGLGRYPNSEISIFNRWDNMVYHSSNYNNDWDGSGLNTGTYYYVLKMLLPTGNYEIKKGWVMLLK